MKIRIAIDKAAALKAGKDRYGLAVVEVPADSLTPEQRAELAEQTWTATVPHPPADYYLDVGTSETPKAAEGIVEATPEAVKLILNRLIDARNRKAIEAEIEKARQSQQRAEKLREVLAMGLRARADTFSSEPCTHYYNGSQWTLSNVFGSFYGLGDDPRIEKLKVQAQDECDRLNANAKADRERQAAENKAQEEAGKKALREWAQSDGSDLLKARIEDGFEWLGLAEREFAASVVADLGDEAESLSGDSDFKERTTPTLEEIKRLREIRKALDGKPATAELKWVEYVTQDEDDGYDATQKVKRAEVQVKVECPTGREIVFYYPCPAAVAN